MGVGVGSKIQVGGGGIQAMPIFSLFRPDPIDYMFHGVTSIKIEPIGRGKKVLNQSSKVFLTSLAGCSMVVC